MPRKSPKIVNQSRKDKMLTMAADIMFWNILSHWARKNKLILSENLIEAYENSQWELRIKADFGQNMVDALKDHYMPN